MRSAISVLLKKTASAIFWKGTKDHTLVTAGTLANEYSCAFKYAYFAENTIIAHEPQ